MWRNLSSETVIRKAGLLSVLSWTTHNEILCANNDDNHNTISSLSRTTTTATTMCERLHKRDTLRHATAAAVVHQRRSTTSELMTLRKQKTEMLQRWERDEDGWRELPARAWPAYQPDEEAMEAIRSKAASMKCDDLQTKDNEEACRELMFQIATTLVFYNLDPMGGFRKFEKLAEEGHVDSMVACGIILVEGLGIPASEQKGMNWLHKAANEGSCQACYELGTVYYTGIDGVVEEDSARAFAYFEKAGEHNHTAALYMMADSLVEGEGIAQNKARAVPLFYRAAEQGHRFARQRIREMLDEL